ncbi:MAG: hypothetical protein V4631_12115 [Pseudomonadota bacterium]
MKKIRFIVRGPEDGKALADFLAMIKNDPDLELVDLIGPANHPHTAVVAVAAELAPSFEQRFHNLKQLMIEQDRPLSLFDKIGDVPQRSERNTNA